MDHLLLEIERMRATLRGIASCSSCGVCRAAALRSLEFSAKAAGEGVSPVTPTPGADVRGLPFWSGDEPSSC